MRASSKGCERVRLHRFFNVLSLLASACTGSVYCTFLRTFCELTLAAGVPDDPFPSWLEVWADVVRSARKGLQDHPSVAALAERAILCAGRVGRAKPRRALRTARAWR